MFTPKSSSISQQRGDGQQNDWQGAVIVMVSSLERMDVSASGKLFHLIYYYARFVHVVSFKVGSFGEKSIHATREPCYTGFCIALRAALSILYCYGILNLWQSTDQVFNQLNLTQTVVVTFCSLGLIVMQFWFNARFIAVTNAFVRLFERARQMVPTTYNFFGTHVLALLCIKLVCFGQELVSCLLPTLEAESVTEFLLYATDGYLSLGCSMMLHIPCLGYLCMASLYQGINQKLEHDILPKLKHLNNKIVKYGGRNGACPRHFKRLNALTSQLDDCCDMYKEIYTLSRQLHKMLEFPVLYTTLSAFVEIVVTIYFITRQFVAAEVTEWNLISICFKIVMDLQMLTLAAHKAIKSSEGARRLSLDVVLTTDCPELNSSLENLLLYLNIHVLKLDVMGLFELSNELILMFLSGIVTFIIYILQFASNEEEIEFKSEHT